jgi:hypothetical protein
MIKILIEISRSFPGVDVKNKFSRSFLGLWKNFQNSRSFPGIPGAVRTL